MKLEQVMFSLRQELSQNSEKQARALKSLNTIKASMQKNKKELKPESQHYLQLQYDIETDKNKTIVSTLMYMSFYSVIWDKNCLKLALSLRISSRKTMFKFKAGHRVRLILHPPEVLFRSDLEAPPSPGAHKCPGSDYFAILNV